MSTVPYSTGELVSSQAASDAKVIDLAVVKKGAKDFLTFVDETKEILYPYLYHRLGSAQAAEMVLSEAYLSLLNRALSFFWFGRLSFSLLFSVTDRIIAAMPSAGESDIDRLYLPSLTWMNDEERQSLSLLHEALWTLSTEDQRILILSSLIGLTDKRIAALQEMSEQEIATLRTAATARLWERWQPTLSLREKLGYFAFLPEMSIAWEASIRFSLVEKYNALRLRRMQWVMVGGMVALFSNVLVASMLAFVVVTKPVTSLRGAERQMVAMDVLALDREDERVRLDQTIHTLMHTSKQLSAEKQKRTLTRMSTSVATRVVKDKEDAERVLELLKRATVALRPIIGYLAWEAVKRVW